MSWRGRLGRMMEISWRALGILSILFLLAAEGQGAITSESGKFEDVFGDDQVTSMRAVCELPAKIDVGIALDIYYYSGTDFARVRRFATEIINAFNGPLAEGARKNYTLTYFTGEYYSHGFGADARAAKQHLAEWTYFSSQAHLLKGMVGSSEALSMGSAKTSAKILFILAEANSGTTGTAQFKRYLQNFGYQIVTIAVGSSPSTGLLKSIATEDLGGNPLFSSTLQVANVQPLVTKVLKEICAGFTPPDANPVPVCNLPSKLSFCFAVDRGYSQQSDKEQGSKFVLSAIDAIERLANRRSKQYTTVQYEAEVTKLNSFTQNAWWAQRAVSLYGGSFWQYGYLMTGIKGCAEALTTYGIDRRKIIIVVDDGIHDTSLTRQYSKYLKAQGFTIASAAIGESIDSVLLSAISSRDLDNKPLYVSGRRASNASGFVNRILRRVCAAAATPTPEPVPLCNLPAKMTFCFAIDRGYSVHEHIEAENNFLFSAIDEIEKQGSRRSKFYVVTDYASRQVRGATFFDGNPISAQLHVRERTSYENSYGNLYGMLNNCVHQMNGVSYGREKIIFLLSDGLHGITGAPHTSQHYRENGYTIVSVRVGTGGNPTLLKSLATKGVDGNPLYSTTSGAKSITAKVVRKLCQSQPRPTPTPPPVCNLPQEMRICFAMDRGYNNLGNLVEANSYAIAVIDAIESQATRRDKIYSVVDFESEEWSYRWAKNSAFIIQNCIASWGDYSNSYSNLLEGMRSCGKLLNSFHGDEAKIMFVLSDGTQGTEGVTTYANFLRNTNFRVVTIGLGSNQNRALFKSIATKDTEGLPLFSPAGLPRNAKLLVGRLFDKIC